jgi:hypothetical protein
MHKYSYQKGMAGLLVLLLILLLLFGALLGADLGYVYYLEECGDEPVGSCFFGAEDKEDIENNAEGEVVTATGGLSEKGYSATITLTIPLEGGNVSGSVSGDCSGKVEGTYDGSDGGSISGNIFGSCTPFLIPIPAKGTFSGVVNQDSNTVPITGTGSAAGFSGSRSMTLTY